MERHSFTQRQQTRRFLTGTLFALSVLTTSGPASAVDGKSLSGSACQPQDQSQAYQSGSAGIFNPSTTATLRVTCPVVRETIGGNSTAGIDKVFITVVDGNSTAGENVVCTIVSLDKIGQFVEAATVSSRNAIPTETTVLGPMEDIASATGGSYSLVCNIPPKKADASGIKMYQVDEN